MIPKQKAFLVSLVFTLMLVPVLAMAGSPSSVISAFMCPCGSCDEALITCECPESDEYRGQILDMMDSGYSQEQIVQDFVERFGSSVLAAKVPSTLGSRLQANKRTAGFVFLGTSLFLLAFASGRYLKFQTPAPLKAKESRPRKERQVSSKKTKKKKKPRTTDFDDDLMDDYLHD
jgi:cytochrome c-type biogenesis protein CcmH/NrfF